MLKIWEICIVDKFIELYLNFKKIVILRYQDYWRLKFVFSGILLNRIERYFKQRKGPGPYVPKCMK